MKGRNSKVRLGNGTWCWLKTPDTIPEDRQLFQIADGMRQIGFEAIDFVGMEPSLDTFYNESDCKELGNYTREIGLSPTAMVYHNGPKWSDPDPDVRKYLEEHFIKAVRVANWLGCEMITTLAQRPYGATPWRLNPRAAAQKEAFHLPDDYDYKADWERLCDSYRWANRTAKENGLRFAIEPHIFSMVSTPHAMLQMLNDVNDSNFGYQLDTNHLIAQRIDPEWTIHMLGGAPIFNVHCKDHDMYSRGNIPCGAGIADFTEIIRALRAVGYDGNLTVELEFTDNPARYNRQAYEHLVKCLAGEY